MKACILPQDSFLDGHHGCRMLPPPPKFYTVPFLTLTSCFLVPPGARMTGRSSRSLPAALILCSHGASHENICRLGPSRDAHHENDFPWFGDPNLSFQNYQITLFWFFPLFFKRRNHFLKFSYECRSHFKILFLVFPLPRFATSIPPL